MSNLKPIPVPFKRRLELFRMRLMPIFVFCAALLALVFLWKDYAGGPSIVGQAEPLQATVNSFKPGVVMALDVVRFQSVKAGDVIGKVLVTDPKLAQTTLAVIETEIAALRSSMEPVVLQQRRAMDYAGLRLDWMRQRAQLGMARVSIQLAEAEYRRAQQLFEEKIGSQSQLDFAVSELERLKAQEKELAALVDEQASLFEALQLTNGVDITLVSDQPLRDQIAIEEAKLQEAIAEVSPVTLRAPVEGMVSMIFRRSGEAVAAGEPILTISAGASSRIVGYLRPPFQREPRVGSKVEVRTRNYPRAKALATVQEVGTQFEMVSPALQVPLRLTAADFGLPICVSIPPELGIRPGELVDITFLSDAN